MGHYKPIIDLALPMYEFSISAITVSVDTAVGLWNQNIYLAVNVFRDAGRELKKKKIDTAIGKTGFMRGSGNCFNFGVV